MQNGSETGMNWERISFVLTVLFLYGIAYNAWIDANQKYQRGFVSLLVAVGVMMTLAGVAVIDWRAALYTLVCFVASGTPMIVGSIRRYVDEREQVYRKVQKAIIEQESDNGDAA